MDKKEILKSIAKKVFEEYELEYTEYNNGLHWKVVNGDKSVDYFPTTGSYFEPATGLKGKGLEQFLLFMEVVEEIY